jgi:hypothetical protein
MAPAAPISTDTGTIRAPPVEAKLASQALLPVAMCGKDFGDFIHAQYDEYGRAVPTLNIKGE